MEGFNSRTHAGCDEDKEEKAAKLEAVSIHAPTRGATKIRRKKPRNLRQFQFTHPRGVRLGILLWLSSSDEFQFTHPRGVRRPYVALPGVESITFQFTHPRGVRRVTPKSINGKNMVSIHAPTRGATRVWLGLDKTNNVSIHAPTRGATESGQRD